MNLICKFFLVSEKKSTFVIFRLFDQYISFSSHIPVGGRLLFGSNWCSFAEWGCSGGDGGDTSTCPGAVTSEEAQCTRGEMLIRPTDNLKYDIKTIPNIC